MEPTDYGIQDGPGPPHQPHPAAASTGGQLFAQHSSAFSHHSHYNHFQDTSSSFNSAWNVNSPYALSTIPQESFNSHDPHSTYSYVPHQQSFATQPPITQTRSPAQYDPALGSGFQSFNHSLDPQVYSSTLGQTLGPRVYQQNSAYASEASFADHDLEMATLPDFGGSATTSATVSPYALLNVPTQQGTDDRGQTSQEYTDQWDVSTPLDASAHSERSNSSSSSNPLSASQSSGSSTTTANRVTSTAPTAPILLVNAPYGRLGDGEYRLPKDPDRPRRAIGPAGADTIRRSIKYYRRHHPEFLRAKMSRRNTIAREPVSRRRYRKTLGGILNEAKVGSELEPQSEPETEAETEDYSEESDEESQEPEISPLPSEKPTDLVGAVRYDTIKALWRPRNQDLFKEQIKEALSNFSQIATVFRDEWGAIGKDEAEKQATPESAKARYAEQRKRLESSLAAALEHGHEFIVEKIGEHRLFLSYLCRVLQERIKDDDYTGTSVTTILDFLSRVTLTQDLLEQLKFSKIRVRLEKRGNDKTRELLKKIDERVASAAKNESKPPSKEDPINGATPKPPLLIESRPTAAQVSVAGTKRPSEGDNGQSQPLKKQATAMTTTGSGSSKMTKSPGLFDRRSKPPTSSSQSTATSAAPSNSAKPKTPQLASSGTGFFAGLKSASKVKPGSTVPKMTFTQSASTEKPAPKAPVTGPPRPVFSIFDTLDSLNKAKAEEAKSEEAKKLANETEEERQKRLRREERRKLRVTFKPEDSLVQIRYFTHDQEEDAGREDNLLRDAADAVEEGRMFKQHKELDVMDEDDDEDMRDGDLWKVRAGDWKLRPYELPLDIDIDFEVIDSSERARNVVTRGGVLEVDSPAQAVEDEREAGSLLVYYYNPADIPPSPREPSNSDDVEFNPEVMFGTPPTQVTDRDPTVIAARNQVRGKTDQAASATPLSAILSKIAEIQAKQPTNNQISTSDLERNFASHTLNSLQSQTARQSQSPVFNSAQVLDVQRIAATLANPQNYNHSQHSLGPQDPKIQNVLAQIAQLNPVSAQETGYQNRGQQDGYWGGADNERRHWGRGQRDDYHGGVDDERDRNRGHHPGGDYDRRSEYKNGNGREYGRMRNEGDDRRGSFEGRRNYQQNDQQKRSIPCSYHARGYCRNGDSCQYQHGSS